MYLERKRSKTPDPQAALTSALILCILALEVSATVQPTIEQRVESADVVAVGYVRRYNPVGHWVFLKIFRVLKGDARTMINLHGGRIRFNYKMPVKGGIDWNYYQNSQEECLFFLRRSERGRFVNGVQQPTLTLSDSLFGVEKMSNSLRRELEELELGVTSWHDPRYQGRLYRTTPWIRIGGLVLFFIAVNVFLVAAAKLGGNKPESPAGKEKQRDEVEGSTKSEDEDAEATKDGN